MHGANRLASNSLLEGLVFGARAATAMTGPPQAGGMAAVHVASEARDVEQPAGLEDSAAPAEVSARALMTQAAGLLRDAVTLAPAVARLERWRRILDARGAADGDDTDARLSSIVTVGWLIASAALRREESRGGHFRADFPAKDDLHWKIHVAENRQM